MYRIRVSQGRLLKDSKSLSLFLSRFMCSNGVNTLQLKIVLKQEDVHAEIQMVLESKSMEESF